MNRENVRRLLQNFQFQKLFINELNWSYPSQSPATVMVEDTAYACTPIAQMSGVVVFEVAATASPQPSLLPGLETPPAASAVPLAKVRAEIRRQVARQAQENVLIFVDAPAPDQRTQSLWYWVKRDAAPSPSGGGSGRGLGKERPREHLYLKGQPGDLFLGKLDSMFIELDELRDDGTMPISQVTQKLAASLDVERVTRKFYNEFSVLRTEFIGLIKGIPREADRAWYASVLLNRLMFVYFLQRKGFIQGNLLYLQDKLKESQARGEDEFFTGFLRPLFFEGFAKPKEARSKMAQERLGDIHYLNGGLFLPHPLEEQHPDVQIPDRAFKSVLSLFGRYSWNLDDTPGAADDEINPDVLGYIFEKYINQKAFGAYYTRTEITQYLCEKTIHADILEKMNAVTFSPSPDGEKRRFEDIGDLLLRLDAPLCRAMLDVLPRLSILDPACGSGAFLVAAMKTMLNLYAAVFGKIRFLSDLGLSGQLAEIERDHPSLNYYIRKRIITDNLFGVDIMDEATEIARLRLFLFLVQSASRVEQLEPLPNIDFNIMAGNSLVGLLKVDETRLDKAGQSAMFQGQKAQAYRDAVAKKEDLVAQYRRSSSLNADIAAIRDGIDAAKKDAYFDLDGILLDDFQALGIKFESPSPLGGGSGRGKTVKRALSPRDIATLNPFHWGYEFSTILARGGFDVVLANPPWEIFKPNAKEFFAAYSDVITKKKMRIEEFEKEQTRLLDDPEVGTAWVEYASRYPFLSAYYRATPQFANQISVVNGKKAGTDINLYKLFTEQCYNLARPGGQVGLVIPSGIYTDLGAKQLREMLFNCTGVTGLFGFENRKTIFEGVDSRFKFVVLTFRKGGQTDHFPAAFMRHDVAELERFPNAASLQMKVADIRRLAPDSLSIPEFKGDTDAAIAEKMAQFPLLGDEVPGAWQVKLSTEFHMTNDSYLFRTEPGSGRLPLYEGKMIHQFTHQWESADARYWVDEQAGRKAILGRKPDKGQTLDYQTYRLGFRDIARNTDSRTLISSIMPPAFHGNKLPTVRVFDEDGNPLVDTATQLFLCAVWNSFVVDALIRQRVTATLNFFYLYQLPIPRLTQSDAAFRPLVERAARLVCTTPEFDDLARAVNLQPHPPTSSPRGEGASLYGVTEPSGRARLRAEIDGLVAHLYGLTEAEFAHILTTFPLVGEPVKVAAQNAYRDVERGMVK